jgi:hypothetical protein
MCLVCALPVVVVCAVDGQPELRAVHDMPQGVPAQVRALSARHSTLFDGGSDHYCVRWS